MPIDLTLRRRFHHQNGLPNGKRILQKKNKWDLLAADRLFSIQNKTLTVLVDDVPVFKDAMDYRGWKLFKEPFSPVGAGLQPAVAAVGSCKGLKV